MSKRHPKHPTTFRLSDDAKDQLQETLDIERQRNVIEGRGWMMDKLNRTSIVERAIASYYTAMKQAQERWQEERNKATNPTPKKGLPQCTSSRTKKKAKGKSASPTCRRRRARKSSS